MRKAVNSAEVLKPSGSYSQVLKVGDFVYISEQVGLDINEGIVEGLKPQVETIFNNTTKLLSELNMHCNQIVKVNIFAKKSVDLEELDSVYEKFFKHPYPTRVVVFVDDLPEENALVKMSFDAIDLSAYEAIKDCDDDGCNSCEQSDCEHH